nr:immunoglobulin light chain junction region [Macaca mulatta]MPN81318.1 immunoglobulin light chain junction region [Macaca mulatta]
CEAWDNGLSGPVF